MTRPLKEVISQQIMSTKENSVTKTEAVHLPYSQTGFFSEIVIDYLKQKQQVVPFITYAPDIDGIKKAIIERETFPYQRELLVAVLKQQYNGIAIPEKLRTNIELLRNPATFTITTAHQPNIFTGPLYFIYKILHAIKLAESLNKKVDGYDFIPVFFMGSEDADLDELGHFTADGKRYDWKTKQTGAVGRMKVDKAFIALLSELGAQLSVLPYGDEIISIFREAYTEGKTIQECTLLLVNTLFGEHGLVVLIPDNAELKSVFAPVVEKELKEQFSYKAVEETAKKLSAHYKVQAGGRALNLFYLTDGRRERIEAENSGFIVRDLNLAFSKEEILNELEQHPERFSPNVILRGVFQEMILPNIAFIGGGGELAYWLELKKVFETSSIPFPVLVLRNSFLIMPDDQSEQLSELGFGIEDIFRSSEYLLNELTKRASSNQLSLSEEKGELNSFYQQLHESVLKIDPTLAEHVNALQVKALKRLEELEKKMLRAEKRKFEAEKRKIVKMRSALFPDNHLQERVENISGFYARYGKGLIDKIYEHSLTLEQQFTIIAV
jgi:bacillithiol biosynthesis cysteine-adding enzyme BshC